MESPTLEIIEIGKVPSVRDRAGQGDGSVLAAVIKLSLDMEEAKLRLDAAEADLGVAKQRIAELEAALAPFAAVSTDCLVQSVPAHEVLLWKPSSTRQEEKGITLADILRAKEALR